MFNLAKVYAPNKEYTGISASVPFVNGVGETDNPHLLRWFESKGYEVGEGDSDKGSSDSNPKLDGKSVEELKVYAVENNIDIGNATSVTGIIKKINDAIEKAME